MEGDEQNHSSPESGNRINKGNPNYGQSGDKKEPQRQDLLTEYKRPKRESQPFETR